MGYTHYWRQRGDVPPDVWARIVADVGTLAAGLPVAVPAGLSYTGRTVRIAHDSEEPKLPPQLDAEQIRFNGIGRDGDEDLGHETFLMDRRRRKREDFEDPKEFEAQGAFSFCKTARKPYDLMVCAALMVAEEHAPDVFRVSSDGRAASWMPAKAWASAVLGRDVPLPRRLRELDEG